MKDLAEAKVKIHVFTQEDMAVTPEIKEYDFAAAQEAGTIKKLQGMLPGATEGTWYVIEIDGIEYYYGTSHFLGILSSAIGIRWQTESQ